MPLETDKRESWLNRLSQKPENEVDMAVSL